MNKKARQMKTTKGSSWKAARDVLLGLNAKLQDFKRGLELAHAVEHDEEDARWVVQLFAAGPPASAEEAKRTFLRSGSDARALCFAALCSPQVDMALLQAPARLQYPLALGELAARASDENDKYLHASRGAALGDATALCELGTCLWFGWGCAQDKRMAVRHYRAAAELGDVAAQCYYAKDGCAEIDPMRYTLLGQASESGSGEAANLFVEELPIRFAAKDWRCVFAIGAACKNHVEEAAKSVFGVYVAPAKMNLALRSIVVHDEACERARQGVVCWLWCSKKMSFRKDLSRVIATMVWDAKDAWSCRDLKGAAAGARATKIAKR